VNVCIYHIGFGNFGSYSFRKFVELKDSLEDVDIHFNGICEKDFDRRKSAEQFVEEKDLDTEVFKDIEEMYESAREHENVLVYDTGPSSRHADNIFLSMQHNYFHLCERPPSLNRKQHLKEKKLAEKSKAMWKVDFIERENPVVKKTLELIKGKKINEIKIFRESSAGIEKIIDPINRQNTRGDDILDKMIHDVYILDFLEKSGNNRDPKLEVEEVETKYFMPWRPESNKLLNIHGGYTKEIDYKTSTGQTKAQIKSGNTKIKLNSSWLGISNECRLEAQKIKNKTGTKVLEENYSVLNNTAFLDEEARFFIIQGEINIIGDMLHHKIYNLETGKEYQIKEPRKDPLQKVMEKAVINACKKNTNDNNIISEKEIDTFMNCIFDIKEEAAQGEFLEELDKGQEIFEKLTINDRKIIETKPTEIIPN